MEPQTNAAILPTISGKSQHNKIKLALLQMLPSEENIGQNLLIADGFCRRAADQGADLAIFPEMFSIGYPTPYNENNSFEYWHAVAFNGGQVDPQSIAQKYRNYAIDNQHKYVTHFKKLAIKLNMAIAITYMSKGKKYPRNTVLIIDRFGKNILQYSKTHLFAPFFIDAICEPGGKFCVNKLDTKNGTIKIGALICADRNIPEPARILMKLGAELVIIPNSCPLKGLHGIILDTVKIRAFENACAIAICNYPDPKNDGYSAVFGPNGHEIFKIDELEQIGLCELDMEQIRHLRAKSAEGDAFREECFYKPILGGDILYPFKDRLDALGQRPRQYH